MRHSLATQSMRPTQPTATLRITSLRTASSASLLRLCAAKQTLRPMTTRQHQATPGENQRCKRLALNLLARCLTLVQPSRCRTSLRHQRVMTRPRGRSTSSSLRMMKRTSSSSRNLTSKTCSKCSTWANKDCVRVRKVTSYSGWLELSLIPGFPRS